jgi:hypothetical protein
MKPIVEEFRLDEATDVAMLNILPAQESNEKTSQPKSGLT